MAVAAIEIGFLIIEGIAGTVPAAKPEDGLVSDARAC
jgi:hypothetical protein